jgi:predicted transcriptional regulator
VAFPHDTRLREIVASMGKYGYSNIPVMKDGMILGVISNKQIIEELGKNLLNKKTADSFIYNTYAGDILANDAKHFTIVKKSASIEQVLSLFRNNQKLRAVLFTETGTSVGSPLGILTTGDLLELNAALDKF